MDISPTDWIASLAFEPLQGSTFAMFVVELHPGNPLRRAVFCISIIPVVGGLPQAPTTMRDCDSTARFCA